jgi:hypothetical protein
VALSYSRVPGLTAVICAASVLPFLPREQALMVGAVAVLSGAVFLANERGRARTTLFVLCVTGPLGSALVAALALSFAVQMLWIFLFWLAALGFMRAADAADARRLALPPADARAG